jgi:hypothetical protein
MKFIITLAMLFIICISMGSMGILALLVFGADTFIDWWNEEEITKLDHILHALSILMFCIIIFGIRYILNN